MELKETMHIPENPTEQQQKFKGRHPYEPTHPYRPALDSEHAPTGLTALATGARIPAAFGEVAIIACIGKLYGRFIH